MNEKAPWLDLLHLPRFTALGLVAAVQRIATVAKSRGDVPPPVAARLKLLREATAALEAVLAERAPKLESEGEDRVAADVAMDESIRALDAWLSAMKRIPGKADKAAAAHEAYFGEGLGFIKAEFDIEWAAVGTRLTRSDANGHSAAIEEMGGKDVLDHVRKMYKQYGKALGITTVQESQPKALLTVPFAAAQDSLRRFVATLLAHGARSDIDPTVIPVVTALLEPLESHRAKNASKAGRDKPGGEETDPGDGTEPAPTDEPGKKPGPGGSD